MELKVGDKVKLKNQRGEKWNRIGDMDCYIGKIVTIHEIDKNNEWFRIKEDETLCQNSFPHWMFDFNDIERKIENRKHFKSLPSDYTGTLEIEKGFIKEILDEKEKEYLEGVVRPFRDRVEYVKKEECGTFAEFICIDLDDEQFALPNFKPGTMYKGMKIDKEYTLKELGLDV